MPKILTLEQTYNVCLTDGHVLPQDNVDIHKIKSMLSIVEEYMRSVEDVMAKDGFTVQYDLNYTIIHKLTEAFLLFDKVKTANHQCLFATLCIRHPELELDWTFFEKLRMKRNGIQYYGTSIRREDWKESEIQIRLYTKTLYQTLKEAITSFEPSSRADKTS